MYKLLIVDDEEIVREGLCDIIAYLQVRHIGQILMAKDGADALSIIHAENPQIILTDLNMPVLGGIEMIKQLQGKHGHRIIVVSGYDDFHLVKESFKLGVRDYLLKPAHSEELLEVLDKIVRELRQEEQQYQKGESEKMLTQMERVSRSMNWGIQYAEQDEHALERVFAELGFSLPYPDTAAAILSPMHSASHAESLGADWDALLTKPDTGRFPMKLYAFYNRQNDLVIWINYERQTDGLSAVKEILEQFLRSNPELPIVIAVGKTVSAATELAQAYRSALEVLSYKLTAGPRSILLHDDILTREDYRISPADLRILAEMIDMCRKDQVLPYIQKYFNDESLRRSTLDSIQSNYDAILQAVSWVPRQKQDFSAFEQSEQLRLYLISRILQTIEARQSLIRSYDMVEIAKKYVDEQLLGEINMAVIANHCNVSYAYFSKLFKESTGVNFQDYVTMKRMDYAKQALNGINVKIYDVASALGYSNPKNFTRVFKNYCGMSPKEYQKLVK
ncbi:hypothetical protein YSY43_19810 [Paenibacillus sp. YSY-4.3]